MHMRHPRRQNGPSWREQCKVTPPLQPKPSRLTLRTGPVNQRRVMSRSESASAA
jgi:hypothetical protein